MCLLFTPTSRSSSLCVLPAKLSRGKSGTQWVTAPFKSPNIASMTRRDRKAGIRCPLHVAPKVLCASQDTHGPQLGTLVLPFLSLLGLQDSKTLEKTPESPNPSHSQSLPCDSKCVCVWFLNMPTRHFDPRTPLREPHHAATRGVRCGPVLHFGIDRLWHTVWVGMYRHVYDTAPSRASLETPSRGRVDTVLSRTRATRRPAVDDYGGPITPSASEAAAQMHF